MILRRHVIDWDGAIPSGSRNWRQRWYARIKRKRSTHRSAGKGDRACMTAGKRVFVAGHRGMVGGAILRRLAHEDCTLLTASRDELDLVNQAATYDWLADNRPDTVIIAAAKGQGVLANRDFPARQPVDRNQSDEGSHRSGVERLLFLGSSCIYPKEAKQPITRSAADRSAGTDERMVRHREDCRHQTMRCLSSPARSRLYLGHADQPLWAGRQFRPCNPAT